MGMIEQNKKYNQPGQDHLSLKHNEKLIASLARKAHHRLEKAGVYIDFEDVQQSMLESYVIASRSYKPGRVGSTGKPAMFSTYLAFVCYRRFNHWAERLTGEVRELGMMSIEAISEKLNLKNGQGEDLDMYSAFASDAATPEEALEAKQDLSQALDCLSDFARFLAEQIINPPAELIEELKAHHAHAELAEAMNDEYLSPQLTISFLAKYYNLKEDRVAEAQKELNFKIGARALI